MNIYKLVWENDSFIKLEEELESIFRGSRARAYNVHFKRDITRDIRKVLRATLTFATNYRIHQKAVDNYFISYDIGRRRFLCVYNVYSNKITNRKIINI